MGHHRDLLSSLINATWTAGMESGENAEPMEKIWQRLLWVATPESIERAQRSVDTPEFVQRSRYLWLSVSDSSSNASLSAFSFSFCRHIYFTEQHHRDVLTFLKYSLSVRARFFFCHILRLLLSF